VRLLEMESKEVASGNDLGARVVILFIPVLLTARLLSLWLPKPLAWSASMFGWMLLIYWVPSRTNMKLRRWLTIVSIAAALALILAKLQPALF
jgi:hypothetical protein